MNEPTGQRGKVSGTGVIISKETGKVKTFTFEGETEMTPEEFEKATGIPVSVEQPEKKEE